MIDQYEKEYWRGLLQKDCETIAHELQEPCRHICWLLSGEENTENIWQIFRNGCWPKLVAAAYLWWEIRSKPPH